ncbi:hypothetical protein [Thalassospira sp.]|uniref:AbiJ-NTD4 domain-containing protein n=1 Tax=Thalassospira sp. TaxID=1912094 RepID=UPI0032EBE987
MLFFERMKTQRGEWPKTFEKDHFPNEARTQCWQLLEGSQINPYNTVIRLRHALGVYYLNQNGFDDMAHNYDIELQTFLHSGLDGGHTLRDVEHALTVIELLVKECDENQRKQDTIERINYRLKLAGVGFKFSGDNLIPIDDEMLTNDAVIPTISLLNQDFLAEPYGYLRQAFIDYKSGTQESLQTAIDNTVKSIEATLKIIFDDLNIVYGPKDTYMPLIQRAMENDLFPTISRDKAVPIANELKALGEIRNKEGGHGAPDRNVSDKAVRLAIHHATANLLYIVETYLERKN